jgi:hypothetical protein
MKSINYNDIPAGWAFCQNTGCPKNGECLRYLACMAAPAETTRWTCILPNAVKEGECPFFKKAETKRMARGLNGIMACAGSKQQRHNIRMALTELLGSIGTYYRYKAGARWINPNQQQVIEERLRKIGYDKEVEFDEYAETYDFTAGLSETFQAVERTEKSF